MGQSRIWMMSGWLAVMAGCAGGDRPPAFSTAMLAPSPPGWFAFCRAHSAHPDAACDPVPIAAAMRDGAPAMAPVGWRSYCQRYPEDRACVR